MRRLELLRVEHRDLDSAIAALIDAGGSDQMQIARLKKRKLRLKDEISALEDQLVPDIIALRGRLHFAFQRLDRPRMGQPRRQRPSSPLTKPPFYASQP